MSIERVARWTLVAIAVTGLAAGGVASFMNWPQLAKLCWTVATIPVIAGLAVSIVRDLAAGRVGVDVIALISMSAAIALDQPLAGAVVALMYSGGNVLEEIAVARAEGSLRALVDRAPRLAHRRVADRGHARRARRSGRSTHRQGWRGGSGRRQCHVVIGDHR